MKWVFATTNRHKAAEASAILGVPLTCTGDLDANLTIEETGTTYAENALLKARTVARRFHVAALADDSGLEVMALGGEPGLYSARFGGEDLTFPERCQMILDRLQAHTSPTERKARFVCELALAIPRELVAADLWPGSEWDTADLLCVLAQGTCSGTIALAPRGAHGFGYDPILEFADLNRTMAELTSAEKNLISHRAQAFTALRTLCPDLFPVPAW